MAEVTASYTQEGRGTIVASIHTDVHEPLEVAAFSLIGHCYISAGFKNGKGL